MKIQYYYIFAIALLVLIGIGIYSYIQQAEQPVEEPNKKTTSVPTNEESCAASGGEWVRAGLAGVFRCVREYSDGGKSCNSSAECEGPCLARDDNTGYCKNNDNSFGCYRTIEDFKEGIPELCVD